ncbi:MAG: TatD family hydrolase [Muribaculaceae bacterium]|nr:TatD family hydrolase [Muribaculaceae bacterium]
MIDTHTHLYLSDSYPEEGGGVCGAVERAIDAGVSHLVFPNIDVASVMPMLRLHDNFPEQTSVCRGLHPTEVRDNWREELREIRELTSDADCKAWGEIGVDLYWDESFRSKQMDAFGEQLDLAYSERLPVIIHSRNAWDETLEILQSMGGRTPGLLFHSFTSGPEDARKVIEIFPEARFAVNGVLTFKNGGEVREALKVIGKDRVMLETDSPFLAPVPKRGRTNESAYLEYIRDVAAATLSMSPEEFETVSDRNAREFFRL